MLKRQIALLGVLLTLTLTIACITPQIEREDVPLAAYVGARASFNYYVESYLLYRETVPDGPEKQTLRDKFEPRFRDAKTALDAWGVIIKDDGDPTASIDIYNKLINAIIRELIDAGIIQVKSRGG